MQFDGAVTRTSKRSATWLLAGGLALAACSGGDDPVPSTLPLPTVAPTTAAPLVTDPTVPPTSPPTTQATTTLAPTTAPTVTTAPPVTGPPSTTAEDLFAQLEQTLPTVLTDFVDAVNRAFREPQDEALRLALADFSANDALDRLNSTLDSYAADGRFTGQNLDEPARVEPVLESLSVAADGSIAGMDACVIDTDPQMARDPSGAETVTDSSSNSFTISYTFERVEGAWRVVAFSMFQRFEGQVGCG